MILYDYFRSSASYRVRIALHYKGLNYDVRHIDLISGDQNSEDYLEKNPQGLVPTLVDDEIELSQSLAIIEYLDDKYPAPPLLFGSPADKAYIRQLALIIACEIHPLNNPKVWKSYLGAKLKATEAQLHGWYHHWVIEGFHAYEGVLRKSGRYGAYSLGDRVSAADLCLIPQLYNARRFDVPLGAFPIIRMIEKNCLRLEAFQRAAPESHPFAPSGLEPIHGPHAPLLLKKKEA